MKTATIKKEKSCGAVIFRINNSGEREFLLIQHRHGEHWSFPKGHVEPNETEEETAIREVEEETGLKIELIDSFREEIFYTKKKESEKKVVLFLTQVDYEEVKTQDHEISDYKWLPYEEAIKKITYENTKDLLEKAEEFLIKRKRGYED